MKIYFAAGEGVREDDVDTSHALWLLQLNVAFLTRDEAEAAGRLRRSETVSPTGH